MSVKKRKSEDGTISLEACIVVPIFIFLILFIYGFIVMFMGQQMISHSMLQSAESLSIDSYGTEKIRDEDDNPATELVITFMENLFTGSFSADSIDSTLHLLSVGMIRMLMTISMETEMHFMKAIRTK